MLRSTMTSPEMTLAAAASSLSETCSLLPNRDMVQLLGSTSSTSCQDVLQLQEIYEASAGEGKRCRRQF